MADEIIKARVWQKVDTESNWNANPLILGPGEAAFVVTPSGAPVNFKLGDGTKTFAQLPWYFDWGVQAGIPKSADTDTVFPPGDPGFYLPTEDGTYDGVTVDLSEGVNYLIWDGASLSKIVYPIDLAGYATTAQVAVKANSEDLGLMVYQSGDNIDSRLSPLQLPPANLENSVWGVGFINSNNTITTLNSWNYTKEKRPIPTGDYTCNL